MTTPDETMPILGRPGLSVPMGMLDENHAQIVHRQSLARLKERGGLSPTEILVNMDRVRRRKAGPNDEDEVLMRARQWTEARVKQEQGAPGVDLPVMDWEQVRLNGGPPCFALIGEVTPDGAPRYCGRAQRWDGHPVDHAFVSEVERFADNAALRKRIEELESAGRAFLNRVDEIGASDAMKGVYGMAFAHGMTWPDNFNWKDEADELRRVLGEVKP